MSFPLFVCLFGARITLSRARLNRRRGWPAENDAFVGKIGANCLATPGRCIQNSAIGIG
jgi:hypothetical protein